ncbi:NUDIX domain-containing protein [Candidatus Nomurabacteria bacterium]|nr:NUDIX domain-containing protein [Candidatus Nomurabacteria bacterium]
MSNVVVVNDKDEIIGTMLKEEAHKSGVPHRIAVVYVENSQNEIIVQVRTDGYLDHSSAGHVEEGESYEEAAKRELSEELGINGVELIYVGHGATKEEKYPGKIVAHVFDIFRCVADPGKLQIEEVKDVYWTKSEDILKDMEGNKNKYCGGFIASLPIYLKAKQ